VIFQQFFLPSLGHASYLVGDEKTGLALVFDPRRDVEVYLDAARQQGLRVAYAADSHGHNDYLSGLSELQARLERGEVDVLDVRQPDEWRTGHIAGATYITGAELTDRHGELAGSRPVAVTCGSGYRSSVAASLLARHGRTDVLNVTSGMTAWRTAGYPLTDE